MAIILMVTALASTASAQQSVPTTEPTTTASTEPQPVPTEVASMVASITKMEFTNILRAYLYEDAPDQSPDQFTFVNFDLSGGWSSEETKYPQQAGATTMKVKEYWYTYSRTSCPREPGMCTRLADDYGRADPADFTFEWNERVTFKSPRTGLVVTFTANPSTEEDGIIVDPYFKKGIDGPGSLCQIWSINPVRPGTVTITTPDGDTMTSSQGNSSVSVKWSFSHSEGRFYVPFCSQNGDNTPKG
jgi:hypothetical protein